MVCSMETLNRKTLFHTATFTQELSRWHCPSHTLSSSAHQPWGCLALKQSLWTDGAVGMLLHCGDWLESYRERQQREKCCDITWSVRHCETTSLGIERKKISSPENKFCDHLVTLMAIFLLWKFWVMCWVLFYEKAGNGEFEKGKKGPWKYYKGGLSKWKFLFTHLSLQWPINCWSLVI